MTKIKTLAAVAVAALLFGSQGAQAHCDSVRRGTGNGQSTTARRRSTPAT